MAIKVKQREWICCCKMNAAYPGILYGDSPLNTKIAMTQIVSNFLIFHAPKKKHLLKNAILFGTSTLKYSANNKMFNEVCNSSGNSPFLS